MLAKLRPRSAYDVMAALALFLVIAGGSAYAANTIFSEDIVDGEVKTPDLGSGAVTRNKIGNGEVIRDKINNNAVNDAKVADDTLKGADIDDNTLKGADIDESTLGQVPSAASALLGGTGRWAAGRVCDPESLTFVDCGSTRLNLPVGDATDPRPRVLVVATVTADTEFDADHGLGSCRLAASVVVNTALGASRTIVTTGDSHSNFDDEVFPLIAVTPPLPSDRPDRVDFRVECNQGTSGAISYNQVGVSAVALSPN
jgi:hypothetical protein